MTLILMLVLESELVWGAHASVQWTNGNVEDCLPLGLPASEGSPDVLKPLAQSPASRSTTVGIRLTSLAMRLRNRNSPRRSWVSWYQYSRNPSVRLQTVFGRLACYSIHVIVTPVTSFQLRCSVQTDL